MENTQTKAQVLIAFREDLKQMLIDLRDNSIFEAPVIQEVILAQRDLESARMRFGVALALQEGKDPLGNK